MANFAPQMSAAGERLCLAMRIALLIGVPDVPTTRLRHAGAPKPATIDGVPILERLVLVDTGIDQPIEVRFMSRRRPSPPSAL